MKSKRLLSLVLVLALVLSLSVVFAACGGTDVEEELDPVAAIAKTELKIGVLHINDKDSTSGYTFAHQSGIDYMQTELGLSDSQIVIKDNVYDTDSALINSAIEDLLAEDCNVIIGTSFGYMEELDEAAEANPYVIFSHGTGYLSNLRNYNNYFGRIYQDRYLSGIVAGLKAKELNNPNLGYVVAHNTYIAECSSGVNAFLLGAQSVYPEAVLHVKALASWYDPTNETAFAEQLINDHHCGVITQHCDTSNPSAAAKVAGKFSVGYNSDMGLAIGTEDARDASVLTSVTWNWGVYYKAFIESVIAGTFTEFGNYYGDFADGLYDLAPLSTACADGTAEAVNLVKAMYRNEAETWDVFSGVKLTIAEVEGEWTVTKTNAALLKSDEEGNAVIVAAGAASVADSVITGNMPYYVKGVIFHE